MACVRPFKHLPGSFQRHLKGFCEMTPAQIMGLFTKASLIRPDLPAIGFPAASLILASQNGFSTCAISNRWRHGLLRRAGSGTSCVCPGPILCRQVLRQPDQVQRAPLPLVAASQSIPACCPTIRCRMCSAVQCRISYFSDPDALGRHGAKFTFLLILPCRATGAPAACRRVQRSLSARAILT
jgi:hypothetical protein